MESLYRVKRGELTVVAGAELMRLSLRQTRRVWKRFKESGDGGLVHRLRGRLSHRCLSHDLRARIVKRHQERYAAFGPTLACEKLADEDFVLSPNTLTALLKERGRRVVVKELSGGRLIVESKGQRLVAQELGGKPAAAKEKKPMVNNRRYKPAADHPWNRDPVGRAAPRVSLAPAAPTRDLHAGRRKAG